jgi:hypothetical protein
MIFMTNGSEHNQPRQPATGNEENPGHGHKEPFNELSELSLEERMAVADKIGIPVENEEDAAPAGTTSGRDDAASEMSDRTAKENETEEPNR